MPGVKVTTATRSGPTFPQTAPGATFFAVGQTERGSTTAPLELRSMADYADQAGARVAYGAAYDALRCFFEEGGAHAYLARVVGPAASVGTRVLQDRAGAPLNTLAVDAKDPGAWSANVTVEVQDGSVAGTFRLIIRYTGTGGPAVETYDNLATPAAAVARLSTSSYVRGRDLASATAAPNNQPAVIAAAALSAGTDDRGSIVAAGYTAALARFTPDLGAGAVAIPAQTTAAVGAALMLHARDNNRLALMAAVTGSTHTAAIAEAQGLRANPGAEFSGLFHPWLTMPDDAGGTRTVDPVGYVAAVRARAHERQGPERAPAGQIATALFVTGTVLAVTQADSDALDDGEVNAVRMFSSRPRLYGWRSLSLDEQNWSLLTGRDVVNDVVVAAGDVLERYVFESIDGETGRIFSVIAGELIGIVAPIADRGGLYPLRAPAPSTDELDPGYRVDTGPNVNTPATLAANKLRASLGLRVSPTAALIEVLITKAGLAATL